MTTKPTSTSFVALCAAALLVPLGVVALAGAAASVVQPVNIPRPEGDDGNLYQDPETFVVGQTVKFTANFASTASGDNVILYTAPVGSNDFASTGKSDEANASGNAYINYKVTGDQWVFALSSGDDVTEIDLLEPQPLGSCDNTSGTFSTTPSTVAEGQSIKLTANFLSSQAGRDVTFLRKVGTGAYEPVGTDNANSDGNAYLNNHEVADGPQSFYGLITSNSTCTPKLAVNPVESRALLDPNFTRAGTGGQDARASATFVPADQGAAAELQVKSIKDDTWKTIETAPQNSSGKATFYISDPLEVEHEYQAVSNGLTTTNSVTYAGPLLDKNTGLATFHFNSNDGESVNTRTKYFDGEFAMKGGAFNCDDEGVVQGPDEEEKAEMKGRGNYSWSFAKKGFTLKLDDNKNLCGMGESKKWALVANHYDRSLLRNAVAYHVGKQFSNLAWTPDQVPVDLYVNGSYRGSYSLVERISIDDDTPANGGRVAIDELKGDVNEDNVNPGVTGGYVLEWDFRHDADMNFDLGTRGWIGVKEPEDPEDDDGISNDQFNYIRGYVNDCDNKLFDDAHWTHQNDGWESCIDKASAVDYYIAMEYLKPVDGNMWASVYMYKPRKDGTGSDGDGKLRMGPLWDFDLAMGSADRAGNVVSPTGWYLRNELNVSAKQSTTTWFNRLNEDPEFRAAVETRWNQVDQNIDPSVFIGINQGAIAESAEENYKKWNHDSKISQFQVIRNSWGADVGYLEDWMDERRNWMNTQLDNGD